MTTTLLHDAYILCLGESDRIFQRGYIIIENERITDVGDMSALPNHTFDHRIEASGKLIMPGLVNAHTHTPMTLFRGLAEGVSLFTLDGWYNTIRTLELVMTADMVPAAVAVACAEMIRTGTTTFADQYFFMDQVIPVVAQSGLRAALGYGVVELGDPVARERELTKLEGFLEEMGGQGEGRLQAWIGPHAFFVDNSLELMERERILAEKYGAGFHIHLSTTGEEDVFCQEHFGMSAAQKMAALGMLDHPIIAAHSVTIPEADWSTLARYPFTAVTCPSASMRAGADAAPVVGMRGAGINIALGTDNVCNSNDYDLFTEMRTLAKLASFREKQPGAIPARDVLAIATAGGAKALGLADQIGDLTPGKQADLIMLDHTGIGWQPYSANDPFTALVYSIHGLQVTDTMVAGRFLLRNQQWMTIDYPAAAYQLNGSAHHLLSLSQKM